MLDRKLDRDFDYFLENHEALVKKYNGKFVVIKDQQVIGAYDDANEAIKATTKKHKLGTFLVQECSEDPRSIHQTFQTRFSFIDGAKKPAH